MIKRALTVFTRTSRVLVIAAMAGVALLAVGVPAPAVTPTPAPATTPEAATVPEAAAVTPAAGAATAQAAYSGCDASLVCFYPGADGTGQPCKWRDADPDWASGSTVCSWALTMPARSVYNHGTSTAYTGVRFYIGTNYTSPNGCMGQGWQGNIGPVFLRSHRWVSSTC